MPCSLPPLMGFWPSLERQGLEVRKEVSNSSEEAEAGGLSLSQVTDGAGPLG